MDVTIPLTGYFEITSDSVFEIQQYTNRTVQYGPCTLFPSTPNADYKLLQAIIFKLDKLQQYQL